MYKWKTCTLLQPCAFDSLHFTSSLTGCVWVSLTWVNFAQGVRVVRLLAAGTPQRARGPAAGSRWRSRSWWRTRLRSRLPPTWPPSLASRGGGRTCGTHGKQHAIREQLFTGALNWTDSQESFTVTLIGWTSPRLAVIKTNDERKKMFPLPSKCHDCAVITETGVASQLTSTQKAQPKPPANEY